MPEETMQIDVSNLAIDPSQFSFQTPRPRQPTSSTDINFSPAKLFKTAAEAIEEIPACLVNMIKASALSQAKLQMTTRKFGETNTKRQILIDSLELPLNTPREFKKIFEKATTDSQKKAIIEIATLHMDKTEKIRDTVTKLTDLTTELEQDICSFYCKGGTKIAPFSTETLHAWSEGICSNIKMEWIAKETSDERVKNKKQAAKKAATEKELLDSNSSHEIITRGELEKTLKALRKSNPNYKGKGKQPERGRSRERKQPPLSRSRQNSRSRQTSTVKQNNRNNSRARSKSVEPQNGILKNVNFKKRSNSATGNANKGTQNTFANNAITRQQTKQKTLVPKEPIGNKTLIRYKSPNYPKLMNNGFTNLSSYDLSNIQGLLGLGLKFIPNPIKDLSYQDIESSIQKTIHRIQWALHFDMNTTDNSSREFNPKLHLGPTPYPDPNPDYTIAPGIRSIVRQTKAIFNTTRESSTNETSRSTFFILQQLKNIGEIKFISADKNLGLVALNTDEYDQLVKQHLNDPNTYKCLGPLHNNIQDLSDIIISTHSDLQKQWEKLQLNKQEAKYLKEIKKSLPPFHILAKLHKSPLKGRPIVGAKDWVTTNSSTLLDIKLQEYLKDDIYSLKDNHALIKDWAFTQFDPTQDWFVSLDVQSLYTNIDIPTAVDIIKKKNPTLGRIAELIMENNYFHYDNKLYHQLNGIAMGTNCAVAIANLYLYTLIDTHLAKRAGVRLYRRYIDDIGFIFTGTLIDLKDLFKHADLLKAGMKFDPVYSKSSLDILDLTFYEKEGRIHHKTYQKPINKYLYIPAYSNHSKEMLKGFIKGEIKRYHHTNSEDINTTAIISLFKDRLKQRGYSKKFLDPLFSYQQHHTNNTHNITSETITFNIPYRNTPRTNMLKKCINSITHPNEVNRFPILNTPIQIRTVFSVTSSLRQLLLSSALSTEHSKFLNKGTVITTNHRQFKEDLSKEIFLNLSINKFLDAN